MMLRKTKKHFIYLLISTFILTNISASTAYEISDFEDNFQNQVNETKITENLDDFEEITENDKEDKEISDNKESDKQNYSEEEEFLSRIRREFNLSKADYRQILSNITQTEKHIKRIGEEVMTLNEQLQNLDAQITSTQDRLLKIIRQIIATENEIVLLQEEIETKKVVQDYHKKLLQDYIRIIYKETNEILNVNSDGSVDAFKLLLSDGTVEENLRKLDYFDLLNEAGEQIIENLDDLTEELNERKENILGKQETLEKLKENLDNDKEQLELQKKSKQRLYEITKGQERIYSELLEQTLKEQEQLLHDIKNLNEAMNFIEMKMKSGEDFNLEDYKTVLDLKTQAFVDFQLDNLGNTVSQFAWPVEPTRISAYFRDESYASFFGVPHNAIDIPALQNSPVRSAADGIVYTARDNGYGYSYIILAHAVGFKTIYGHITEILVDEGQPINQGTIIGLSGGMPGTKGAGYMTTGPHLHFEILLNGQYVDPMRHLPLEVFSAEQIEGMPEKYHDDWRKQVLEIGMRSVVRY